MKLVGLRNISPSCYSELKPMIRIILALLCFLFLNLSIQAEENESIINNSAAVKKTYDMGARAFADHSYGLAIYVWEDLAKEGDSKSQYGLGICYELGLGVIADHKQAVELFKKASSNGSPQAYFILGLFEEIDGKSSSAKFKTAAKLYTMSAKAGEALASFYLASLFELGYGTKRSVKDQLYWLNETKKLFKSGNVIQSACDFRPLFKKYADEGSVEAQYKLGAITYYVNSPCEDKQEAEKYLNLAAASGHIGAKTVLGDFYRRKDDEKSLANYYEAANAGMPEAQFRIGFAYFLGLGVPKDYAEAARWMRRAAGLKYPQAISELALFYKEGIGVRKNLLVAYALYNILPSTDILNWTFQQDMTSRGDLERQISQDNLLKAQLLSRRLLEDGDFLKVLDGFVANQSSSRVQPQSKRSSALF